MRTRTSIAGRIRRLVGPVFGFTLIEMIMVMLIIALGTGVFLGYNFQQQDRLTLQSAVRRSYAYVGTVKSFAQLKKAENRCLYSFKKHRLEQDLNEKTLSLPEKVHLFEHEGEDQNASQALVTFYADGSADQAEIVFSVENQSLALHVEPLLGEVTVVAAPSPEERRP